MQSNVKYEAQIWSPAVAGQSKVNDPAAERKPSGLGTYNIKSKVPKQTKIGSQRLKVECLNGLSPSINCRYDSSLGKIRL